MSVLPSCGCCGQAVVVSVAIILALLHHCSAKHRPSCPSSSCGDIRDIKYPFRLKGDPGGCGLPRYELDCVNNVTMFTLFSGKYYVKDINYKRYEIRLTDAGVVEDTTCSFPRYFLSRQNFSIISDDDPLTYWYTEEYAHHPPKVVFLNCSDRVSDDPRYVEVRGGGCDSGGHIYAVMDRSEVFPPEFTLMDVKAGCRLKVATFANWTHDGNGFHTKHERKVSYADILRSLEDGFWLSWLQLVCRDRCQGLYCNLNRTTQQIECGGCQIFNQDTDNCGQIYSSTSLILPF
ncbi:unnamed protein product [Sphenostylis stenocarpa]|uniref:Wall-associated receptor kinase galacturonan-binding domain-containing protein n=1 Tax=Sphenostylis stenocarpa TaxID=92480 RepID=A0AA86SSE5_9FABA|nr:unnamed protein product [Sphenostylis stenocarpa]